MDLLTGRFHERLRLLERELRHLGQRHMRFERAHNALGAEVERMQREVMGMRIDVMLAGKVPGVAGGPAVGDDADEETAMVLGERDLLRRKI